MYNPENKSTWTREDHSRFLHAVANGPDDIAGRWQEMADAIPGKTAEEVKAYFEAVEHELLEIEAGRVELPYYPDYDDEVVTVKKEDESVANVDHELLGSKRREKERKKATPWTVEEHKRFLQGLEVYGKGDWRSISRNMVVTRTATQVASHAQKYFLRQASFKQDNNREEINNNNNNMKKKKKRRRSIHDITTADTAVVVQAQPTSSAPASSSGQGRSSASLWPNIPDIGTMVVHAQPITSTPPPPPATTSYFYGGQLGWGAPQPGTSFYGEQGGGPPRYDFIKTLGPDHNGDYSMDEEFSFKDIYLP